MAATYTIIVRNIYARPVATERKLTSEQVLIRVAFHLAANNIGKGSLEIFAEDKSFAEEFGQ